MIMKLAEVPYIYRFSLTADSFQFNRQHYKVLCHFNNDDKYIKNTDNCYLSWTSKGVLMTSQNKTQIRINEIINTLKTMDNHFGKKKFRSGNIPFTMFGPFDQKTNVLFKDNTDSLKTTYELMKVSNFPRNLESFLENLVNQQCNDSSSVHQSIVYVISTVLFVYTLL